jgi:hypothetical protein
MTPELYKLSVSEDSVTFFLYNGDKLTGFHQYRPNGTKEKSNDPREGRYFTYLPKETTGLFGLEQDFGGPLYIVEGIFKAAKLHSLGYSAVAVLGATPKRLKGLFKIWRQTRPVIAIGDNDSAGAQLVQLVGRGTQSPKDLDEMTDEEVRECLVS